MGDCCSIFSADFYLRVAMGLEPNFSSVEKFGENPDVNGAMEDVWSQGGMYTYSTAADIDSVSSSSVTDTQQLTVIGQTADYAEVIQTVVLNGQNRVALPTPLRRVYRGYNIGSVDFVGDVYCFVNTALLLGVPIDVTKIRFKIPIGSNQTEMCIYTIPLGWRGFFIGGYVSINKMIASNFGTFTWKLRLPGEVFRVQSRIACIGAGSSHWSYKYGIPVPGIPAGSDIVISVDVAAANTACAGGFTILQQRQAS